MTFEVIRSAGPLWADARDVDEQALPLWRAALLALGLEIILPFLIFGVSWSFLPDWNDPPPTEVMSVRLGARAFSYDLEPRFGFNAGLSLHL